MKRPLAKEKFSDGKGLFIDMELIYANHLWRLENHRRLGKCSLSFARPEQYCRRLHLK